jgi:hypothetical protein
MAVSKARSVCTLVGRLGMARMLRGDAHVDAAGDGGGNQARSVFG